MQKVKNANYYINLMDRIVAMIVWELHPISMKVGKYELQDIDSPLILIPLSCVKDEQIFVWSAITYLEENFAQLFREVDFSWLTR